MNSDLLLLYLEEIVMEIFETVLNTDHSVDDTAALQEIYSLLDQFGVAVQDVLPRQIIEDYFGGVDEATAALIAAGEKIPPTLALTQQGLIAQPFQKVIHLAAVEYLLEKSMTELTAAINTAKEAALETISQTLAEVKQEITRGLIIGNPRKVTTERVMKAFLDGGLTAFYVEDKNGMIRRLPLNFYAMTVVRSITREATVQGSANRFIDAGQDLVKIRTNGDSCEECSRFKDMVVSLTGKTPGFPVIGKDGIRLPPFHPNCRCGTAVFILQVMSAEEIATAKQRNSEFSLTEDRRTPAQKKAYENEQRKRRIANAELKQFQRWQAILQAEAPKTLPAFRRMKRQNTVQFQLLQSEIRSRGQLNRKRKT